MAKKRTKKIKLAESPQYNNMAPNQRPSPTAPSNPRTGRLPEAKTPFPAAYGATSSTPAGLTVSDQPESNDAFDAEPKAQTVATGNSGTQIFGGYFSEEYLQELRGRRGAQQWDEMRRSEAQISMILSAVFNPIKSANWDVEPYDQTDPECVKDEEFCKFNLFEMIDFSTFKHEALTMVPFGFSLFEIVHCVVFNNPKYGTFNGLKKISFRAQKSIENWQLETKTGRLIGVNQYTYSDLGGNEFIPGEFLLPFTLSKEGDNYEGISALRPMLGAYKRKNLYLQLAAIGMEKYAVGTPVGTIPKGKERTTEADEFKKVLAAFTSHESAYITKPEGWGIDITRGDFDASKVKELLAFENTEMANAMVANFLALGMNGSGGAYALGSNLGEFFQGGMQSYADLICDGINKVLFPQLIKLNFGERNGYPKLRCTGISDKAGKDLAEAIKLMAESRMLEPDAPLKDWLRKQYKMPAPDPKTTVPMPLIPAGATANFAKPGEPTTAPTQLSELKLAESKFSKQFDNNKLKLKVLMKQNLQAMYDGLKKKLRSNYASLSSSSKILAAKGIQAPGLAAYKSALKECLAETAAQSIYESRKLLPKEVRSIKLSEDNYTLAEGRYKSLPTKVKKLIDVQSQLISETQAADLEKSVFFQFTSSATVSDDIDNILNDVDQKVQPSIEGSTADGMSVDAAAGNATAQVTSESSLALFFEPDVLDTIESFTFTNEDPISEICQELAGQTFAPGDADLDKYTPPMHHNCKSRLVPNIKGDKDNPEIDTGVSVSEKALKSITLHDLNCHKRIF